MASIPDCCPLPFFAIHEVSLMMALGERVLEAAAREGAEQVLTIHLRVGTLAGVDALALQTAAEIVLAGTLGQGARLAIEEVPPAWWCVPCHQEFTAVDALGDALGRCPACGHASRDLLRGQDLILHALELDP